MEKNIGPFSLYEKVPNDIRYGFLYTAEIELPVPFQSKRTIRVYLPEDYDPNKTYPLLVMSDGQNIVDRYTTAFGAWDIDVRQHEWIAQGNRSFIVLGIDCPKKSTDRAYEYSFPHLRISHWERCGYEHIERELYSHIYYDYVATKLIPYIREYFPISNDKKDIASGGSSMGGCFAISLWMMHPEIIGTALSFSPGFFLFHKAELRQFVDNHFDKLDEDNRLFMYVGDVGFEHRFVARTKDMYSYYLSKGMDNKKISLLIDEKAEHNEHFWSLHFLDAIKYWQNL